MALEPWHSILELALAVKLGGLITLTLEVWVLLHPLLLPVTVYTVLTLGLTTIKELLDPVFQL